MIRNMGAVAGIVAGLMLADAASAQNGPLTQEGPDQWRASKLVGVAIYGPDNTSVGKISDLLMGRDGKVQYVIVGIGGLLGIGEKDVAIPYDQVTFSDQPVTPPAASAPAAALSAQNGTTNATTAGASAPAGTSTVPGSDRPMAPAASDVLGAPAHSAAYPEHGTITMTAEQIRNAPTFHYAQ
jgi:sporulation protein YlmC with PRC-barrel domain